MARQAMGKGNMGKVEVADLQVNAGSTVVKGGKKFTLQQTIIAVYVTNNATTTTFTFDGATFTTNNENVEII